MRSSNTFKERKLHCQPCGSTVKVLLWDTEPLPACANCSGPLGYEQIRVNGSAAIHGDEIHFLAEHGVCWEDGSPRLFTSRAELKREEIRRGVTPLGETPHQPKKWF